MAVQENVVPIWGVQRESELDQFLQCIREGAELTDERRATIERDRPGALRRVLPRLRLLYAVPRGH